MNLPGILSVLRPYYYRNHLFVQRRGTGPDAIVVGSEYTLEYPANVSSIEDAALADVAIQAATLRARCAEGNFIGLVRHEGAVVHRTLVQRGGIVAMEGDRCAFTLAHGDQYVHSCVTAPSHRGRKLYSAVLQRVVDVYNAENRNGYVYIACRQENAASVKAIVRGGFQYLRSELVTGVAHGRIRLRRWYTSASMTPRMPIESPRTQGPAHSSSEGL